ncbi:GNAT superfamily N-acetyltransferase [Constrictibacter sp. MBR-5]|jgi:GNAT superfamily N-acetyltransferase|uniref:GNAT family N-acetyltransferase n=1 Tax=Constrictibacter sp. MBR-5 TaxID=3156467 RepID=UPI00339122D3
MRSTRGDIVIENLTPDAAAAHVGELARLRMTVFRAYPYLYDGSAAYEERYLATYLEAPRAVVVAARHGDAFVGAATALPMAEATAEERAPFEAAGWAIDRICYFGESVLLDSYRGRGIGVAFFEHREAHARALGLDTAVFCAVDRGEHHPAKPAGYAPLDGFWRNRGYRPLPFETTFRWKDIGEDDESAKRMLFWAKDLSGDGAAP